MDTDVVGLEADDQLVNDRVDDVRSRVRVAVGEATVHQLNRERQRPTADACSAAADTDTDTDAPIAGAVAGADEVCLRALERGASGGEDRGAAHFVEREARDDERRVARGPRVRREHVACDRVQERLESPHRRLRVLSRRALQFLKFSCIVYSCIYNIPLTIYISCIHNLFLQYRYLSCIKF